MSSVVSPASAGEAIEMLRAAMGYLAAADAAALTAEEPGRVPAGAGADRRDRHRGAGLVPGRVHRRQGYSRGRGLQRAGVADAQDRGHPGAAAGHTAWASRAEDAPARSSRRWPPGSCPSRWRGRSASGRTGCRKTSRDAPTTSCVEAAAAGLGLRGPGRRCSRRSTSRPGPHLPDEDQDEGSPTGRCGWRPPSRAPGC